MYKYVIKRILLVFPILFAVTFITFSILNFIPGDPGRAILGDLAPQEAIDQLNHEFGVDLPFFERFFKYMADVILHFDFGDSYRDQKPVVDEMLVRFPYTLRIAFFSVFGSSLIGIPAGVLMAAKRNMIVDRTINILGMTLSAIPSFFLGLMLIYWFALELRIFPAYGAETWRSYVLPLTTLILPSSVGRMRLARTTMLETIRQEYITMARMKGIPESRVIFVHALKNSMIPLITSILMGFSGMLGGAMITETVFALPGLGSYIVQGTRMKDMPIVLASTIFLAAIFCFTILILDIIYAFIDPRIKSRYVKTVH